MTVYADTSAVVKLYVDEPGSAEVRLVEAMYVCDMTRVEVPAALWRKSRMGEIDREESERLLHWFEDDAELAAGRFIPIEVTRDVLRQAASLTGTHALRAYDAVQLAVAIRVAEADSTCRTFASFDRDLNVAATHEGFELLRN